MKLRKLDVGSENVVTVFSNTIIIINNIILFSSNVYSHISKRNQRSGVTHTWYEKLFYTQIVLIVARQ